MMKHTKQAMNRRDLFLIGAVLCLAAALLLVGRITSIQKENGQTAALLVDVSQNGKIIATLDLSKDQELFIENPEGGSNRLIIQNGEAWVSEATCPDHICIRQGHIRTDGEVIVCLPNRLTVSVRSQ